MFHSGVLGNNIISLYDKPFGWSGVSQRKPCSFGRLQAGMSQKGPSAVRSTALKFRSQAWVTEYNILLSFRLSHATLVVGIRSTPSVQKVVMPVAITSFCQYCMRFHYCSAKIVEFTPASSSHRKASSWK